jgi:uncharacterized protein involved in outer membrane biogenesis
MSRKIKIGILVIAVMIVLLVIGYVALQSFLSPARLQTIAQRVASETMQRPVEIGRVGLRLGFNIGITVGDISVPNTEGFTPGPMLEIDETILNLSLWPLLTRKIVINSIGLKKMTVNLEQNKNKELNFAALMPREVKGSNWKVSLSSIRISSSELHYLDASTGSEYAVKEINQLLKFRGNRIAVSGNLAATVPKTSNIPELDIRIDNVVSYDTLSKDIEINRLSVSAKSAQLKVSGTVQRSSNLDLDGTAKIDDLSKVLNLIPTGTQPEALGGALAGDFSIKGSVEEPAIGGRFELKNIKLVPKGMERGIEKTNGSLSFNHSAIENISIQGNIGGTRFNVAGAISGINTKKPILNINLDINGDLKDFQGMTKDMKDVTLSGGLVSKATVRGTTEEPQLTGDVRISDATIDGIGLKKPISSMYFSGKLQQTSLRIESCKGVIGHSDFSFTGQVSDFKKPTVRIDNHSKYIDLDELMPEPQKGQTPQGKAAPVNLQGSLSIARLTGMEMEFKNVSATFKYADGAIDLKDGRAQAFDGDVFIDFYYDTNKPEPYQLSTRMQYVSSQKILHRFLKFDRLQGKLSGTGKFQGRGLDQKSVTSNLDALGNLLFTNGKFTNYPLMTKLLDWLGMKNYQSVEFNKMQCSFTIARGKANIEDLTLTSRTGDFLVNGTIGLDGRLDLAVAATLTKNNSDIVKRYHGDWLFYVDKQGSAVIDFIISGKNDSPTFKLDSSKMKQRLSGKVKDEFKQKQQEFEQKIRDWLKWK